MLCSCSLYSASMRKGAEASNPSINVLTCLPASAVASPSGTSGEMGVGACICEVCVYISCSAEGGAPDDLKVELMENWRTEDGKTTFLL